MKVGDKSLYFHVRHYQNNNTLGKVEHITSSIINANRTGIKLGFEPQCISNFKTQLSYYSEFNNVPVMATVLTSDGEVDKLSINQIMMIEDVCPVESLRIHEAISYYRDVLRKPFPEDYVKEILAYAKSRKLSVFWNEWDWRAFPQIAKMIESYEDTVIVSFGTNANYIEPSDAYQKYLQQFKRKGASVQSWYWYERNNRKSGTEMLMPPALMRLHAREAFQAGCELVQFEPYWYFFKNIKKLPSLEVIGEKI